MLRNSAFNFLLLLLACASTATAFSPRFLECQVNKTACPPGTIFVSQNASEPGVSFTSLQEAILSLPEEGDATIRIAAGSYHETVNVTRSGPLTFLGELPPSALTTDGAGLNNGSALNLVEVWDTQYVQTGMDDADSAVLTVAPSRAGALIGAGPTGAPLQPEFGNVDFKAYNINFANKAANYAISQALVTDISYANASFYGCAFASYQDTWYTGRNGSTYVVDSVFYGQTDCVFLLEWFQDIILANRACGGGISAWKGTNQTDAPGNRYGAYIWDARVIRSPDANSTTDITKSCYLGRPWNDLATTVFLNTFMEDVIQPIGWTTFSGRGNTSARLDIEHILSEEEAQVFTVDKVFLEHPAWIDYEYVSSFT
ncbi:pectin lyase fold/virulence factor [Mucidula mucida]|nr:pectin lyase fold/virulence factor [Mucidula mucida]